MSQTTYQGKFSYHGETASTYEKVRVVEAIWQKEQSWVANYLRSLQEGAYVLDIPFGTGRFVDLYDQHQMHVVGVDISGDMLKEAHKRLHTGNQPAYHLVQSDAENLSLDANSVDGVLCFRLIHLMPIEVIRRMTKEFARVSRRFVVIQVFDTSLIKNKVKAEKHNPLRALLGSVRRRVFHSSIASSKPDMDMPWLSIPNFSYREVELLTAFQEAGLNLKAKELIEDETNPSRIYCLEKR